MAQMQRQEGEEPPAEFGTQDFAYVSCTMEDGRAAMSGVFTFVPGRCVCACDACVGPLLTGVGVGAVCGSRRARSSRWCARALSWTCRSSLDKRGRSGEVGQ